MWKSPQSPFQPLRSHIIPLSWQWPWWWSFNNLLHQSSHASSKLSSRLWSWVVVNRECSVVRAERKWKEAYAYLSLAGRRKASGRDGKRELERRFETSDKFGFGYGTDGFSDVSGEEGRAGYGSWGAGSVCAAFVQYLHIVSLRVMRNKLWGHDRNLEFGIWSLEFGVRGRGLGVRHTAHKSRNTPFQIGWDLHCAGEGFDGWGCETVETVCEEIRRGGDERRLESCCEIWWL